MWRPAIESLRAIEPGHTTLAIDMPGEGESVGTFRGLEAAIEQLHVAIAAAGIENPVIVGHSGSAIGAMFYAMKYPVRGIVNVDAVLDTADFSARLRALAPQLRNGGIPAIWDELFTSLHAERSGAAGEAMLRATSRPRPDVMLGYWAPVLAPPPTAENGRRRRDRRTCAREQTPLHARTGRGARCRDAQLDGRALSRGDDGRDPEQRALSPRRPPRRVRPHPRECLVVRSGRVGTAREIAATVSDSRHGKTNEEGVTVSSTVEHQGALRILLVLLGVPSVVIGLWAGLAPRGFYDDFPGAGRSWVAPDGPFNEHLVRDVGVLNLALAVVTIAAAVWLTRPLVRARPRGPGSCIQSLTSSTTSGIEGRSTRPIR